MVRRALRQLTSAIALAAALILFGGTPAHADSPHPNGRTYAVLVGIADYPSSPLPRTDVDAERIGRALATVRENGNQSEQSWEAFELYGRRGVPVDEVAERLGMKPEAIRQAKSRISRQVRAEIERLRGEEG